MAPIGHRRLGSKGAMVSGRHVYVRAGIRIPDRYRDLPNANLKGGLPRSYTEGNAGFDLEERDSKHDRAAEVRAKVDNRSRELLYSRDDEDFFFFQTLRGMVDCAVQLLEVHDEKQSFIDTIVVFISQRLETLSRAFDAKDAACAFALRLRRHAKAHDATMLALGIRAGIGRPRRRGRTNETRPPQSREDGELEEHELQPVILWREWKRCGGYWPLQLPDPDDVVFEQPHGTDNFISRLDGGTQAFLREISQHVIKICLPEDGEDLRVACETATRKPRARGDAVKEAMFIAETANRLAQLKGDVLELVLCEVLTQQVVGRFCLSGKLCDLMLNILSPGADLSLFGHNLKDPETFSLVSKVLQRLGSAATSTLRTELMQGRVNTANGRQGGHINPAAQGEGSSDCTAPGETSTTTSKPRRRALATEVGGNFKLSNVLVGEEEGAFDCHLEEVALEGLAEHLRSEIVDKIPLANVFLSDTWVPDRVEAARAFARRPTNLMLVLSVLEAAKDILRAAGERCKDSRGVGVACSGVGDVEEIKTSERGSMRKSDSMLKRMGTRNTLRRRRTVRRDTPGWRTWEARREMFFRADLGVAGLHMGRSLLGQEAIDLADRLLKALSFEYNSLETRIRHDASKVLQRCSEVDTPEMLVMIKPLSTLAILYISCQMRMLRALRGADLDFSKTPHDASERQPFGDGPRSRVLSQRFRSYSWVFTDVLIDKLVALKVEQVEHARDLMVASTVMGAETEDDSVLVQFDTKTSQDGGARAKRLGQEWAQLKRDVMQEITVYASSKDLLSKVVESWLPEVLAADLRGANGDQQDRIPELYL